MKKSIFGLDENLVGLIAYAGTFFTGIPVLILEKENKNVRFHALQSTIWFLFLAVAGWVVGILSHFPLIGLVFSFAGWALGVVSFVSWLFLMYSAFSGKQFKIPVIGDVVWAQINK
jgi:uncharacterized membrane protein